MTRYQSVCLQSWLDHTSISYFHQLRDTTDRCVEFIGHLLRQLWNLLVRFSCISDYADLRCPQYLIIQPVTTLHSHQSPLTTKICTLPRNYNCSLAISLHYCRIGKATRLTAGMHMNHCMQLHASKKLTSQKMHISQRMMRFARTCHISHISHNVCHNHVPSISTSCKHWMKGYLGHDANSAGLLRRIGHLKQSAVHIGVELLPQRLVFLNAAVPERLPRRKRRCLHNPHPASPLLKGCLLPGVVATTKMSRLTVSTCQLMPAVEETEQVLKHIFRTLGG